MLPRERRETGTQDLFRSRLDQIINMNHELVRLAKTVSTARQLDQGPHRRISIRASGNFHAAQTGRTYESNRSSRTTTKALPKGASTYESEIRRFGNLEVSVRSVCRACHDHGADLIEAGLNEGAGCLALWGFIPKAAASDSLGLPLMALF